MQRTTINYATHSSNPIRARRQDGKIGWACTKVSPGCQHCYAEAINRRFGTGLPYTREGLAQVEVFLDEQELQNILRTRGGKRVFVGDMMDIFLDEVSDEMLDRVFGVFAARRNLTFLVLTKRAERMQRYLSSEGRKAAVDQAATELLVARGFVKDYQHFCDWPLPNLWVGVTAENQQQADERIPHLLRTPAAVRWVSCEPLLGPIDLGLLGTAPGVWVPVGNLLHWVVVGGESGPKARPMHPAWAESLRDQGQAARVSFFFKAWGAWYPDCWCGTPHPHQTTPRPEPGGIGKMFRCGKSAGVGRRLEGQEWNKLPDVS